MTRLTSKAKNRLILGLCMVASTGMILLMTVFEYSVQPQAKAHVEPFSVDLITGQVSSEPTINPSDPYNPMPLRVGTVGASTFHRPFCPYAKKSLETFGLEKRINYWTREQVAESNRPGDSYCLASVFECHISPVEFATSKNDPWCGANIRATHYSVEGIDEKLAGKTLCSLQGRLGVFVDQPEYCINGAVRASRPSCDKEACEACTTDCETACLNCVRVTIAPLNKVTLGMGDANRDGQTDIDDYLFFHECYSGWETASIPCQNVFDFDEDHDVDIDDFDLFVHAYDTGNESWAIVNHPGAVINPPKPELPLRVGTVGSNYYHRLNCPSVNNSWSTHGLSKRVDFFTWDQVEASGRIPDTRVCLAGTRQNPSGSLQNCTLDDDGDGTLNCDDQCPLDANKTIPGNCGCGKIEEEPCR